MSDDYKVPYTTVLAVENHPNADRLDICTVYGFQVVAGKGQYKVGDSVLYVPVDSVLPVAVEDILFPPDSKIKLHRHRVRQIRIRKFASQGMLINPTSLGLTNLVLETNYAEQLGISKYEPPAIGPSSTIGREKQRNKWYEHPMFHKYNGLDNIKWFPTLFKEGEPVVIQEKLHGTNARASKLPYVAHTWWRKAIVWLGLAPKWENRYGSNNVDITARLGTYKGFYNDDVYGKAFKALDVFNKIRPNETVFGEIVGDGIQKNYHYGHDHPTFVLFDVKTIEEDGSQRWLSPKEVEAYAKERGFTMVPILHDGPYSRDLAYALSNGPSVYYPKHKVREGVVIKSQEAYCNEGNKRALKWVSELYLDDADNTDHH